MDLKGPKRRIAFIWVWGLCQQQMYFKYLFSSLYKIFPTNHESACLTYFHHLFFKCQFSFNICSSVSFYSWFSVSYTIITLHSSSVNPFLRPLLCFPSSAFQTCHSVSFSVWHQDCWARPFPLCSVVSTVLLDVCVNNYLLCPPPRLHFSSATKWIWRTALECEGQTALISIWQSPSS